ncbi:MAG TPA: hypothetical protein PLZ73_10715, partial [bacterium]|nr:hypothetical protein [bacterium]
GSGEEYRIQYSEFSSPRPNPLKNSFHRPACRRQVSQMGSMKVRNLFKKTRADKRYEIVGKSPVVSVFERFFGQMSEKTLNNGCCICAICGPFPTP